MCIRDSIYAWLKDGAGPEATTDRSRDAWEDIAKRYDGVRETVRQALRDGQVAFEGEAGDAMAQRVEPLAAHADTAQQAATSTADAIGQQGTDFRDARNQVVPPVAVPDKPFLNDLAPWETDYDEAKADSRAADEHDIRVLNNYWTKGQSRWHALAFLNVPRSRGRDGDPLASGGVPRPADLKHRRNRRTAKMPRSANCKSSNWPCGRLAFHRTLGKGTSPCARASNRVRLRHATGDLHAPW